jgi:hypothetical protein
MVVRYLDDGEAGPGARAHRHGAHTRTVRSERALDNEASARQIWDMAHGGVRAEGGTAHCQATDRSRGHRLADGWTVDCGLWIVDWWGVDGVVGAHSKARYSPPL